MKRIWIITIFAVAVTAAFIATSCDTLVTEVNEVTLSGYPEALIDVDTDSCCLPCVIKFYSKSNGPHHEWLWDFGDGNTSVLQDPSHSYALAGKYTVILTITDTVENNDNREIRLNYITVKDTLHSTTADLAFSPLTGSIVDTFTFSASDFGTATTWFWDFGDSSSSTEISPTHVYAAADTFEIRLTITNDCDSLDIVDTLIVE